MSVSSCMLASLGDAAESLLASTRGTESLFMFRTALYNEQPLVVRGQGAGGPLTASGVLGDILAIGLQSVTPTAP